MLNMFVAYVFKKQKIHPGVGRTTASEVRHVLFPIHVFHVLDVDLAYILWKHMFHLLVGGTRALELDTSLSDLSFA